MRFKQTMAIHFKDSRITWNYVLKLSVGAYCGCWQEVRHCRQSIDHGRFSSLGKPSDVLTQDFVEPVDMAEPTQEMKRHAVIVSLAAGHTDSETAAFLKVADHLFSKFGENWKLQRRKVHVLKNQGEPLDQSQAPSEQPHTSGGARNDLGLFRRSSSMSHLAPNSPDVNPLDYYMWGVVDSNKILNILTGHFCPKPNVIVQRYHFNKHNQGNEPIATYIAELRRLSENCEFVDLDDRLRDRLVCGLRKESLVKRLLSEAALTSVELPQEEREWVGKLWLPLVCPMADITEN
ncbi:hypothetical protein LAZ67_20000276 [Cordylochernes scorpioides]|uniref:Retrotransposon gag domain-containing protein n=1 Tax=Cordylochernes scorpioides TaxID=51811 RepID=A0ABY6LIZ2_9ARAC|nr:hypothetical protein LAZ67_20000276 [Cordylochernes scorpioides]